MNDPSFIEMSHGEKEKIKSQSIFTRVNNQACLSNKTQEGGVKDISRNDVLLF